MKIEIQAIMDTPEGKELESLTIEFTGNAPSLCYDIADNYLQWLMLLFPGTTLGQNNLLLDGKKVVQFKLLDDPRYA